MTFPDRIGRLRRLRPLGVGGFASVWLFHDDELDSDVAVKALAENWASDSGIRTRFLDEARLLRQAQSDHVVRVHDIGTTDDDIPYFVMTYADQGSVADLLRAPSPPSPTEVADIVEQAARGLAALHAHQVVHRDIKPENLLLAGRPGGGRRVLVADLGVAKALTVDSGATMHVGTPSYAAPEQADPGVVPDPRADVHGLGAVAYALITGRPPRAGLAPGAPVPPVRSVVPDVPEPVERVVMAALEPDREHRWPDARSFAAAFAAAVHSRPSPVPFPQTPAPARTRPRWLVPAVAAAVLVLVAAVALVLARSSPEDEFMAAGREYLEALASDDCEALVADWKHQVTSDPPELTCSKANLHWSLAQCFDLSQEWRVDPIGEDRARVVVVRQGYVEMIRVTDDLFEPGFMATGYDSVCPEGTYE
jgi:serine/threonine protein kinase